MVETLLLSHDEWTETLPSQYILRLSNSEGSIALFTTSAWIVDPSKGNRFAVVEPLTGLGDSRFTLFNGNCEPPEFLTSSPVSFFEDVLVELPVQLEKTGVVAQGTLGLGLPNP